MFEDLKKILDEQLHLNGMEITKESRIKEDRSEERRVGRVYVLV